jgi:hypothetical protein
VTGLLIGHRHLKGLTPWHRVLPEKLIVTLLVKKFSAFYGTQRFITVFTRAHHLKVHLQKLLLLENFLCSRSQKFSELAQHILCYCESLLEHTYHHFRAYMLNLSEYHVTINRLLQFIEVAG